MLMYIGIVFTFVLGILLHFTYAWSRRSLWIAFLAPTNESLFEQMKLLLTPYLLWVLVEYTHYGQFMHAFIPAKVISLYLGLLVLTAGSAACKILSTKIRFALLAAALLVAFTTGEFLMTLTFMDSAGLEIFFDGVLVLTILAFAAFTIYPPQCSICKSSR